MKELKELREKEFEDREKRLKNAIQQKLIYCGNKEFKKITYVMTWTGICGGTKIILEHANRLSALGYEIFLISHDNKPEWFKLDNRVKFINVPWGETLCNKIPDCDLIVATYWREIYECVEQKKAPVIYFEQGDFHLFDLEKLTLRQHDYIKKQLETIHFVFTVSSFAQEKLKEIYNKDSIVIPNAVDEKIFYYEPHNKNEKTNITIIGSEEAKFKNIEKILAAIRIISEKGYNINLNWITPTEPIKNNEQAIVNPAQVIIGDVLRNTDIYICASMYESFCLPVLEAMTCGAAVITTDNGGNMDFVKENFNALVIEKNNIEDIVNKIEILINDENLRNKIAQNGIQTSKEYSWDSTIKKIINYYKEVANYKVKKGLDVE